MIYTRQNGSGASYYRFENLAAFCEIDHGIFTRRNGYSPPPFDSLNVSLGTGDAETNVVRNRDLVHRSMAGRGFVYIRQVHGDNVAVLKGERAAPGKTAVSAAITADALVTDLPGKYLVIQVADCQAVLLYDPVRRVVANVHCGWRGSLLNIIGRTLLEMSREFDCRPEHIQAGIGPSLGPCCAEFVNFQAEIPADFWGYKDASDHFDFWAVSCDQMKRAGVAAENIEVSRICTRCRTDEFYSYRAEKTTGRFAAVIGIK